MSSNPISQSNQFEFNDSVLTTKAWNSSRYDGRQLSAAKINRFTVGDSTYGKTPVIQNYSRNIYIGNDIVGMSSITGEAEDNSLLQFDNFSYAQTNTYITVNEDDSITFNTLNEPIEDDYSEIIGFYQAFYDDFKQGTYCKIIINDLSQKNNLRPSYPIWFNGGQFQKLLKLTPGNSSHLKFTKTNNALDYDHGPNETTGFLSTMYDETLLNEFYTGSLVGEISFQPPRDGDDGVFPISSETGILAENIGNLIDSAISYKNNSSYKGDKRFFASFLISGSEAPIRTITTGSVVSMQQTFRSNNLAELSTAEFQSHSISTHVINFTENTKLHQDYISINQTSDPMTPPLHGSGSVIFSQVNDTTPSLLIELNKSSELPEGTGNKPFIILPHNIHPFIKDNLLYFLTQAGIDVGGNTSTVLKINPSNRLLK